MGTPFNLSANLTVQGPKNIPGIVADIRKQLKGLTADVKINIDASSVRNLTAFNAQLKQTATLLAQLAQQNNNTANSFTKANTSAQTLGKTVHDVGVGARQAASDMYLFGQQAGHAARRFLAFAAPVATLFALKKAISEGVREAIDFEKQMLIVSQVTGKTFSQIKPLSDEISNLGKSLGVSSKELAFAAQTLAQAGLSAVDTSKALDALAKTDLVGTFGDIKDTTEGTIAVLRQFKMGAGELEQAFADVNRVTGEFASESKDIFTAVSKAGGSFAAAGGTFKEFTAVVTTLRDTTRESAETIATGLQTIFARIQRSDTIDSLRDMGIELRDLNGEFIGPTQAILKIGDALKNVSTKGQKFSDIKELLGGTRQIGKVVPLLQNTDKLKEIIGIANEGEKNLTKFGESVAKSQDILANKLTKVTEQFNELFRNITNDATFKSMANTALDLASAFIKVADSLRPLLPLLIALKTLPVAKGAASFGSGFLSGLNKVNARDLGTRGASLLTGRAKGGIIPGSGDKDSEIIAAMPGEYIINKRSAQKIGYGTLSQLNKFADGGIVGGDLPSRDERGRFLPKSPEKLYSALLKLANSTDKLTAVQSKALAYNGTNTPRQNAVLSVGGSQVLPSTRPETTKTTSGPGFTYTPIPTSMSLVPYRRPSPRYNPVPEEALPGLLPLGAPDPIGRGPSARVRNSQQFYSTEPELGIDSTANYSRFGRFNGALVQRGYGERPPNVRGQNTNFQLGGSLVTTGNTQNYGRYSGALTVIDAAPSSTARNGVNPGATTGPRVNIPVVSGERQNYGRYGGALAVIPPKYDQNYTTTGQSYGPQPFQNPGFFGSRRPAGVPGFFGGGIFNGLMRGSASERFGRGVNIASTGSLLSSALVDSSTRGGARLSSGLAVGGGVGAIIGAINPLAGALAGLTAGVIAAANAAKEFDKKLLLTNLAKVDKSGTIKESGEAFQKALKDGIGGDNGFFANAKNNLSSFGSLIGGYFTDKDLGASAYTKANNRVQLEALNTFQSNTEGSSDQAKDKLSQLLEKEGSISKIQKSLKPDVFQNLLRQAGSSGVNIEQISKITPFEKRVGAFNKEAEQIGLGKLQKEQAQKQAAASLQESDNTNRLKASSSLESLSISLDKFNAKIDEAVLSLGSFKDNASINNNIFSGSFNKIGIRDDSSLLRGQGNKFNDDLTRITKNIGLGNSSEVKDIKELNRLRSILPKVLEQSATNVNGEGLVSNVRANLKSKGVYGDSTGFRTIIADLQERFKGNRISETNAKIAGGGSAVISDEIFTAKINKLVDGIESSYKTLIGQIDNFGENLEQSSQKLKQVNESRFRVEEKSLTLDKFIAGRKAEQVNGNPSNFLGLDRQTAGFGRVQNQLTGLGDNATNPTAVAGLLRTLSGQQEGAVNRREFARLNLNPNNKSSVEELENASKSLADLQFRTANASEALERLANRSDKLAAAQERLVALEGDKEGRLDFFTRFAGADRAGRGELNKEAQAAFKAFQTRDLNKLSIDEQNQATRFLSSNPNLRLGGTDVTSSQLLRQLADVGIGGVNAKQTDEDKKESEFLKDIIQGELQSQIEAQTKLTEFLRDSQDKFFTQLSESFDTFLSKLGNAKGFAGGGTVFKARGTDTVPAMLSPDEVIVSAGNAKKNKGILAAIQGGMNYFADGRYPFKMPNRKVDSASAYQNNPHQQLRYESSRRSPVYDEEGSFGLQERNDLVMFNDSGAATHSRQATGKIPVPKSAKQVSDERIAARLGRAVRPVGEAYTNQAIINPKRVNPVKASDSELADQGKLDAFNRKLGRSGANNDAQLLQKSRADAQRQLKNLATDARQYNSPQNQAKLAKQALVEAGGNTTQAASLLAGQNTAENLIRNSKISSFQTQARTGRQDQSSPQLIGGINTLLQQAGQGGQKGIEATKALEVLRKKNLGQFIDEAEKGGVRAPIIQGGVNGGINNPRVRQDGGRNNFNDGATRFQQSNDAFKTQVAAFSQSIATLEKTIGAIPKTIELTGKHEVNVNVNGVEVFGAITPMVENLVTKSVNEAFKARGDQFAGEDKLRNNLG